MTLAAAVSGLDIEFVDGVLGGHIDPKTLDLVGEGKDLRASELGIWRAHLNVYREIVRRNITSALIMEVSCSPLPGTNRDVPNRERDMKHKPLEEARSL